MTSWTRTRRLPGIEIARAELGALRRGVMTTDYAIVAVDAGAGVFRVGREVRTLEAGETLVVAPLQPILARAEEPGSRVTIVFIDPLVLHRGFCDQRARPATAMTFPTSGRPALDAAIAMLAGGLSPSAWSVFVATLSLAGGLASAVRRDERSAVAAVRDELDARTERIRIAELAELARFSASYLIRVFAEEIGLSLRRYHLGVRLARARDLLRLGHPAVKVAAATGFTSARQLARHFVTVFGVLPSVYASSCDVPAPPSPGVLPPFVDP